VKTDQLLDEAKRAADRLHADTRVSLRETFGRLQDLRDHVEVLMEAVSGDLKQQESQ
jgi:hypothetical protein